MVAAIKWPHDYTNFMDLCSVANISIIIFNEDLQGYYIHGKSPNGHADVSSEKLRLQLENEAHGNSSFRGICASLPDQQTFRIAMPKKMIEDYKRFLNGVKQKIEETKLKKEQNYDALQRAFAVTPSLPDMLPMND
mmetsp:Transcript_18337/g.28161  ORF Transcript_18337/g.28161 Transcript_18337/m.28161 type:complete len:136 (-) Transcript_18337:426-833(-)